MRSARGGKSHCGRILQQLAPRAAALQPLGFETGRGLRYAHPLAVEHPTETALSRPFSRSPLKLTYLLFLPLFFASGFAALLYQMVWQRLLTFFSGADLHAVTLIVAVYMAGLGFGSLAGGYLADRLPSGHRYLVFAAAEAAVAVFALLSKALIYDTLFLRLGERPLPPAAMAVVLFLCLLWPTFFMGLSLPLLARIVTQRPEMSAERIGGL